MKSRDEKKRVVKVKDRVSLLKVNEYNLQKNKKHLSKQSMLKNPKNLKKILNTILIPIKIMEELIDSVKNENSNFSDLFLKDLKEFEKAFKNAKSLEDLDQIIENIKKFEQENELSLINKAVDQIKKGYDNLEKFSSLEGDIDKEIKTVSQEEKAKINKYQQLFISGHNVEIEYDLVCTLMEEMPTIGNLTTKPPTLIKYDERFYIYGIDSNGEERIKGLGLIQGMDKFDFFTPNVEKTIRVSNKDNKDNFFIYEQTKKGHVLPEMENNKMIANLVNANTILQKIKDIGQKDEEIKQIVMTLNKIEVFIDTLDEELKNSEDRQDQNYYKAQLNELTLNLQKLKELQEHKELKKLKFNKISDLRNFNVDDVGLDNAHLLSKMIGPAMGNLEEHQKKLKEKIKNLDKVQDNPNTTKNVFKELDIRPLSKEEVKKEKEESKESTPLSEEKNVSTNLPNNNPEQSSIIIIRKKI